MDITNLFKGAMPSFAPNITDFSGNRTGKHFPDSMMKGLIPLLGGHFNPLLKIFVVVYQMVGSRLGLDPTVTLTLLGFLWAAHKMWKQLFRSIYGLVQEYLMANIHISSSDEIYLHVMKWLSSQPRMTSSRSLAAETISKTAWEEENESDILGTQISADGSGVYLNFSSQEAKAPPRFTPAPGLHGFWFKGRYFRLRRKQESYLDDQGGLGSQTFKDRESLVISCFGRSPEPIKKLLQHAKEQYYSNQYARTIVKRPIPVNSRRYGGRYSWVQVASRPVRPMKTVVLDAKQKVQVLADMNEYLHPATPRWYASRGIPLRRGYLFFGPPGSGKTSLVFSLAGVFGLEIFIVSLLNPALTEEDLGALFNSLPRRCIVLLEDIDAAGLSREPDLEAGVEEGKDGTQTVNEWKVTDLARALKGKGSDSSERMGISLSGLLNVVDGVASHEGRVLIMTTNRPEALDEALLRPGRVDLQVCFANTTQAQAKELFELMYEADYQLPRQKLSGTSFVASAGSKGVSLDSLTARHSRSSKFMNGHADGHADGHANGHVVSGVGENTHSEKDTEPDSTVVIQEDERLNISQGDLSQIAAEFAAKIPDGQFSPAEIQGFLLKRKKHPRKALAEVDKWVEAMLEIKSSKSKVLQVQ